LRAAAATYEERNAVYGDNFRRVGNAMVAMFPDGLTLKTADDWNRAHLFLLGVVKQTRYAVNFEKGGHRDSVHDSTVYSAMLEAVDQEIVDRAFPRLEFQAPDEEGLGVAWDHEKRLVPRR
jgi:hypothetical protein